MYVCVNERRTKILYQFQGMHYKPKVIKLMDSPMNCAELVFLITYSAKFIGGSNDLITFVINFSKKTYTGREQVLIVHALYYRMLVLYQNFKDRV